MQSKKCWTKFRFISTLRNIRSEPINIGPYTFQHEQITRLFRQHFFTVEILYFLTENKISNKLRFSYRGHNLNIAEI